LGSESAERHEDITGGTVGWLLAGSIRGVSSAPVERPDAGPCAPATPRRGPDCIRARDGALVGCLSRSGGACDGSLARSRPCRRQSRRLLRSQMSPFR